MFWQGILIILTGLINIVIGIFPTADSSIVSQITTSTTTLRSMLSVASVFIPISQLFIFLSIMISTEILILTVHLIRYVLRTLTLGIVK